MDSESNAELFSILGIGDPIVDIISEIDSKTVKENGLKIESVYHGTAGLSSKNISVFINNALMQYGSVITDYIPKEYIEKYDFLNKKTALNIVHNPSTYEKLKQATETK